MRHLVCLLRANPKLPGLGFFKIRLIRLERLRRMPNFRVVRRESAAPTLVSAGSETADILFMLMLSLRLSLTSAESASFESVSTAFSEMPDRLFMLMLSLRVGCVASFAVVSAVFSEMADSLLTVLTSWTAVEKNVLFLFPLALRGC